MADIIRTQKKSDPESGLLRQGEPRSPLSFPLPTQPNINQTRAIVKQYSFFNSLLQMEAPELVPTPNPYPIPWGPPDARPLLQPGGRKRGVPPPQNGPLKKILVI